MPPSLASRFTTGQLAVLRIVADEVKAKGVCGLCVDAIAARAGVCRRLAQIAIRLATGDGLLTVQERRHEGRKSSPNLIRVISREWQVWMKRARPSQAKGIGCKTLHPTDSRVLTLEITRPAIPSQKLPNRQGRTQGSGSRDSARAANQAKAMR